MFGIASKTNGVKLLAAVAVLAMVVCAFAVTMPADETDAASGDTQSYSGNLTWNQVFDIGTNVVINDDLTISKGTPPAGASEEDYQGMVVTGNLTINEGVTVTIKDGGSLSVQGGLVTINGDVEITGDGSDFKITGTGTPSDYEKTGVVVNGTVDVIRGGTLSGTSSASILVNNGATLSVSSSGSRISNFNGLNVDLATGGTFDYNGKSTAGITVTAYGDGDITSNAVVSISPGAQGGDEISDLTFTASGSRTTVYYTPTGETGVKSATMRVYTLNVSGTVEGGSTLGFKGEQTTGVATNNIFYSSEEVAERYANAYYNGMVKFAHDVDDIVLPNVVVSDLKAGLNTTLWIGNASTPVMVTVDGNMNLAVKGNNDEQTSTSAILNVYGVIVLNGTMSVDGKVFAGVAQTEYGGIIVNGTLTVYNNTVQDLGVTGAGFIDDDDTRFVYGDLQQAIDAATAANVDEINVYGGYKSSHIDFNGDGVQNYDGVNQGYGSFVIDTNVTVPADMTITIGRGVIVQEGVTLTFAADAIVEFEDTSRIWVDGKLVDYDNISTDEAKAHIDFEVMSSVDDGDNIINTYTSFVIALSETTSGTIYLYSDVEIDRNLTIPSGVTVEFSEDANAGAKIYFKADTDYTLTVDGTISISQGHTVDVSNGNLAVNNVVKSVDDSDTAITGNSGDHTVDGAYFYATIGEDDQPYHYVTSVSYAAANSTAVEDTNGIRIFGNVAMGDVTFTAGDEALTIAIVNSGNDKATGNVTLSGDVTFTTADGTFDGTVNASVTAGDVSMDFDNVMDAVVSIDSTETVDGTETVVLLYSNIDGQNSNQIDGAITISSGEVTVPTYTIIDKLVVSSGATLNVEADIDAVVNPGYKFNTTSSNMPLITETFIGNTAGLIVEGTMVIGEGANVEAYIAYVTGDVTVNDGTFRPYLSIINGTVTAGDNGSITLDTAVVNGTVSGDVKTYVIVANEGSDLTGAEIVAMDGADDIMTTNLYVNGDLIGTLYGMEEVPVEIALLAINVAGVQYDTSKLYIDDAMTECVADLTDTEHNDMLANLQAVITAFRTGNITGTGPGSLQAALGAILGNGTAIGTYSDIYIGMDPANVRGTVSEGTGLNIFIDGVAFVAQGSSVTNYTLSVGTHTVRYDVVSGYDGSNAVLTFNGQTIENGATIEITADMTEFNISASGAVPSSGQVVIDNGSSSDMGLTDYLLIILVILIVVMAIIVAMRLMRS